LKIATVNRSAAVSSAYAAFNRGEIEVALALMCNDVNWPNTVEGGRERGRKAVRAYWRRLFKLLVPNFDLLAVRDDGRGRTIVHAHLRFSDPATGQPLAHQYVEHVFSWRGAKVVRMDAAEAKPLEPAAPAQAARAM
jgi:ketosteroid isomerase-like protein